MWHSASHAEKGNRVVTQAFEQKYIKVRLEDSNEETGFISWTGFLVNESIAVAVLNNSVELQLVKPTSVVDVFDLENSSDPIFKVEENQEEEALEDLTKLSLAGYFAKYAYVGFENDM